MEMLRTFVVALFFAGITVCSYYFLNSYPLPWLEEREEVVEESGLPTSKKEALQIEPFSHVPAEPMVSENAVGNKVLPSLPPLPTLELPEDLGMLENQTAALPVPAEIEERNPFEMAPSVTVAEPQHHVGNPLPGLPASLELPVMEEVRTTSAPPLAESTSAIPSPLPSTVSTVAGEVSNPLRLGGNDLSPLSHGTVPTASSELPTDVYAAGTPSLPTSVPETSAMPMEDRAVHEYLMQASSKIQSGQALEVLRSLSPYYGDPRFNPKEQEYLVSILVQAATQVVYSQKSFLEPAYVVQNGDTLEGIAQTYRIPTEFIARVNGLQTPYTLTPGQSLKVLRGPFNAIVYLDRYELILTLNGLFAGRFWIGVGGDLLSQNGDFYFRQVLRQNNPQQGFAFEFVQNPAQAIPGQPFADSLILHPSADASMMGKNVARGNILLSQTDMSSLLALVGKDSKLILRSHSPHAKAERASTAPVMAESPLPTMSNPIASPLEASIGTQASLPGYESPTFSGEGGGIPATGDLPTSLPGDLPTELPNY